MRVAAAAVALATVFAAPALAQQAIPVGTVAVARQAVSKAIEFVGRIEAINRVELRARVSGYLDAVLFKEGDTVRDGDKLFQIDAAPFQAAVQQARGALLQAQGTYANASLQRKRAEELVKTSATSVAERDLRVAQEQNAQGAVIRADADLRTAQINLGYTTITAPITGRIGRALATKGNLVGPDSGPLAVIVSQDPMFVTFPVSQREFLRIRAEGNTTNADTVLVRLRFADGSVYPQEGKIDFVDVAVDRSTDTVIVRARVPNPQSALIPGQFVRVSVVGTKPDEKMVVPQAALIADQEGTYVFVAEGGKAVVKRVKTGVETGGGMVIESGLSPGELVIVNGTQSLRPGAPVLATPMPDALTAPPVRTQG